MARSEFCADKDLVMECVQSNGLSLKHASEELRSNRDVVEEAVQQCGRSLEFASEDLLIDSRSAKMPNH